MHRFKCKAFVSLGINIEIIFKMWSIFKLYLLFLLCCLINLAPALNTQYFMSTFGSFLLSFVESDYHLMVLCRVQATMLNNACKNTAVYITCYLTFKFF